MTPYTYQRGETISLALDAVTGDPAQITAISAAMKPVLPGRTEASASAPFAASFTVTPRLVSGDEPAGWRSLSRQSSPPACHPEPMSLMRGWRSQAG